MPIYLKFDNITGDSAAANYQGWIEVQSFDWATQTVGSGSNGGVTPRQPVIQPFSFKVKQQAASASLLKACLSGALLNNMKFRITVKLNGQTVEVFALDSTNCRVTAYQTSAVDPLLPTDTWTLNLVSFTYKVFTYGKDKTTTTTTSFDIATGRVT